MSNLHFVALSLIKIKRRIGCDGDVTGRVADDEAVERTAQQAVAHLPVRCTLRVAVVGGNGFH